ncbi:MAG: hypothetical protein A2849_00580 [Candidatus Taylorbacteria bacterium RIFCSPHIGHO2_01_FULL_51_15]|uniref:HTH arsR-type domain-containing protein n=1 Tax=Candidatus Taylorbacteria bacterium RIFCSPHIGHO2_01_FULL_51_15 TaxID=1802304 RepID=A0A1G2M9E9_9BACT|nr:MAG: hypothetical protein A2849_00580 [Candidatus Taylorbacteria bacterium RIFCSPHIGHO2_01_FULL_51_15]
MDILGKLFGSESKVKIMRLFLFNPETPFTKEDVAERARVSVALARHELSLLRKMRLIRNKGFVKRVLRKSGKKNKFVRTKVGGLILNPTFPYFAELQRLLIDTSLLKGDEIVRKLSRAGRLKLVITAGVFIHDTESRVDMLVVADHLRRGTLEGIMRGLEAEIGKELQYAAFETGEFNYRLGMYDKLIRDILDFPHKTVLDRIGLPPMEETKRSATAH